MRKAIRFAILSLLAATIALSVKATVSDFFMAAVFNVSGIMFSLGLGLIVTFNTGGIKNKEYVRGIRENLRSLRKTFIIYFAVTVACYIIEEFLKSHGNVISHFIFLERSYSVNWSAFLCVFMIYSIVYFICNFLEIQKFNNDIFDELNK